MFRCKNCSERFNQPDERNIDAGGIRDSGIIGKAKAKFITLCPYCLSTNFEKEKKLDETA